MFKRVRGLFRALVLSAKGFPRLVVNKLKIKRNLILVGLGAAVVVAILIAHLQSSPPSKTKSPITKKTTQPSIVDKLTHPQVNNDSSGDSPATSNESPTSAFADRNLSRIDLYKHRIESLKRQITVAVENKDLTTEEAAKLNAKLDELSKYIDSLAGKPYSEIRTAVRIKEDELRKWARDNKLPYRYLEV